MRINIIKLKPPMTHTVVYSTIGKLLSWFQTTKVRELLDLC